MAECLYCCILVTPSAFPQLSPQVSLAQIFWIKAVCIGVIVGVSQNIVACL